MDITERYAIRYEGYFWSGLNLTTNFTFKVIGHGNIRILLNGTWLFGGSASYQTLNEHTYNEATITLNVEAWHSIRVDYYVDPPEAGFVILWKDDKEEIFLPLSAGVTSSTPSFLDTSRLSYVTNLSTIDSKNDVSEISFDIPIVDTGDIDGYRFDRDLVSYIDVADDDLFVKKHIKRHDLIEASLGFKNDNRMLNFNGTTFGTTGDANLSLTQTLVNVPGMQWMFIADSINDVYNDGDNITSDWVTDSRSAIPEFTLERVPDIDFVPVLVKNNLGGRSIITHQDDQEYFDVDGSTFAVRERYNFLHYESTFVVLVRPDQTGGTTRYIWSSSLANPTLASRGLNINWREDTQRFAMFAYSENGGVRSSSEEDNDESPGDGTIWYLMFFELDSDVGCRIYKGSSLSNTTDTFNSATVAGDSSQNEAAVGRWYNGGQDGLNCQWAFLAAYNRLMTAAERLSIVGAVNRYYGTNFS